MAMTISTEYGRRLIPHILDSLASAEPDRIIYSVARFSDSSHEFRHISARTFAKAVDKTAWWLHEQVGQVTWIETVGYIGPRKLKERVFSLKLLFPSFPNHTKMIFDIFC